MTTYTITKLNTTKTLIAATAPGLSALADDSSGIYARKNVQIKTHHIHEFFA
jgi:hypothetical protein